MNKPRIIIGAFALGLTLLIWVFAFYLMRQTSETLKTEATPTPPPQEASQTTPPKLERPRFRQTEDVIAFTVGTTSFRAKLSDLEKQPVYPFGAGDFKPVRVYAENGSVFVDATLPFAENMSPVEIKGNEYTPLPPGWDANSNSAALEIVRSDGLPIFQLIYQSPSHVIIKGLFLGPTGLLVADNHGLRKITDLTKPQYWVD